VTNPANRTILCGSPGVGKSTICFMTCLIYSYQFHQKLLLISRPHLFRDTELFLFVGEDSGVMITTLDSLPIDMDEFRCVLDGFLQLEIAAFPFKNVVYLICTSGGWRIHSQDYTNWSPAGTFAVLYQPAWTLENLTLAAIAVCSEKDWARPFGEPFGSHQANQNMVARKYRITGGSFRELLLPFDEAKTFADAQLSKVKAPETQLICEIGQTSLVGHISRIFLVDDDYTYTRPLWRVDSQYYLRKLANSLDMSVFKMLLAFGKARGGALFGITFEEYCHKVVSTTKALSLRVAPMQNTGPWMKNTTEPWMELKLDFTRVHQVGESVSGVFNFLSEGKIALNEYWHPDYCGYPVVDAGCVAIFNGFLRIMHFQYTVAQSKSTDLNFLSQTDECYAANRHFKGVQASVLLYIVDDMDKAHSLQVSLLEQWIPVNRKLEIYVGYPISDIGINESSN